MKTGIPSSHFGLRITAKFRQSGANHGVLGTWQTPTRWTDGRIYAQGTYSDHGNPVCALANWLMPREEGNTQPARARCISYNPEEGTISADCYGEHAGRVLSVFQRLGARELDAHGISV